jgi:hypothetical protein
MKRIAARKEMEALGRHILCAPNLNSASDMQWYVNKLDKLVKAAQARLREKGKR